VDGREKHPRPFGTLNPYTPGKPSFVLALTSEVEDLAARSKQPWPRSESDGMVAVFKADPSRISCHEAKRRMKRFLASLEEHENEEGKKWQVGTRTVEVTIPDIDLAGLDWPESVILANLAFGTVNPIAAEYGPPGGNRTRVAMLLCSVTGVVTSVKPAPS
jgi:hypothetical protein